MSNLAENKKYTYADYIKWNDKIRYELIDGIAYAMASPSRLHQKISGEMLRQFANSLRGKTCEVYHAPFDVRLNVNSFDDIVLQPDILVVCDESKHDGRSVRGAPDMIIEIISPFNSRHDTVIKFKLYQRAGVREYWIVDPARKTVEIYILKNGKYGIGNVYRDDDIVPVHILEGCQINLADVFYDTIESDLDEEARIKQKVIDAFKEVGISNELIEKAIKILN